MKLSIVVNNYTNLDWAIVSQNVVSGTLVNPVASPLTALSHAEWLVQGDVLDKASIGVRYANGADALSFDLSFSYDPTVAPPTTVRTGNIDSLSHAFSLSMIVDQWAPVFLPPTGPLGSPAPTAPNPHAVEPVWQIVLQMTPHV
jgi:hypothetical protein